jgi:selenocysteine-specific elongation factor
VSAGRTIVVGTAGHIDHGKSSLVKALTGTDPDRLKEEKLRGITIELGFAHAEVAAGVTVSFVDVPGHERFVRTMLAGVGGIDAVVLVVAADESVMPQTREHFDICRVLQVPHGAVVLTKADAVDAETLELATLDVRELVAGSFLDGAPIVPVSAVTGHGLDALRAVLAALARATPPRDAAGLLRLPVDRAFSMRGFGTVVTGTLVSGQLAVDDDVQLLPTARTAKVRGLQVHGRARRTAVAGERVAVNLAGVDVPDVPRGGVLARRGTLPVTRRVDAEITLLPDAAPVKHGTRVRLHQGTAEVLARLSLAGTATSVPAGGRAFARLRLESPAVLTRRDRFILRSYSPLVTIGGGVVIDPDPPRAAIRSSATAARLTALRPRDGNEDEIGATLARLVAAAGPGGRSVSQMAPRLGQPAVAVSAAARTLEAEGTLLLAGDWLVDRRALAPAVEALLAGIAAFHRQQPLAEGLPLEEARARWFARTPAPVVERVVGELVAAGRVVARDTIALAGHRVALSAEESDVLAQLDARFRDAGLHPPDVAALAGELRRPGALIDRMLQHLVKQKRLIRVDTLVFHQAALDRLKADMAARKAAAAGGRATVDVKAFKDAYDVTRKFAIPLLEYLDRERVTRRAGDVRIVL